MNLVSIIIPTYKRSEYLLQTIKSVLNQTYSPIEIIVVDDNGIGSEYQKATQQRLQKYIDEKKVIYITHKENKNGAAARNTGFKVSKGEYINFLDDDDELMPTKIEEQVKTLEKAANIYGATYCNSLIKRIQNITKHEVTLKTNSLAKGNLCREYLMNECPFNTSTILFRRSVIEKLNGFDETFVRHQDYELLTRFFAHYEIMPTGLEPLVYYDLTKDRTNLPNPEKDYEIKEKFLGEFTPYFDSLNCKNDVCHYMWLQCALCALLCRNKVVYLKAIDKARIYSALTMKDRFLILKCFIIGLLK